MTSDCRGEARGAKPKRSASYRGIDICIISMAQQASPKVIHIKEPVRAHVTRSSTEVTRKPLSESSWFSPAKNLSSPAPRLPACGSNAAADGGAKPPDTNPIRALLYAIHI